MIGSLSLQNSLICEVVPAVIPDTSDMKPHQTSSSHLASLLNGDYFHTVTYHRGNAPSAPSNSFIWAAKKNYRGSRNGHTAMQTYAPPLTSKLPRTFANGTTATMRASPRLRSESRGRETPGMVGGTYGRMDAPEESECPSQCSSFRSSICLFFFVVCTQFQL